MTASDLFSNRAVLGLIGVSCLDLSSFQSPEECVNALDEEVGGGALHRSARVGESVLRPHA
jgi:hypothetical protein